MSETFTYFASRPPEELAPLLTERASKWNQRLSKNGLFDKWEKSFQLYYGRHFKNATKPNGSEIVRMGRKGELAGFALNHYRNLIRHILVMSTSQKPSFDARAINSDLKSLQQARLANNILDAYMREKRLGRYLYEAAERALVFGKGFIKITWEPSLGRPYGVQPVSDSDGQPMMDREGKPVTKIAYEGDLDVSAPLPWEVFCDEAESDWNRIDWVCTSTLKNRFTLAARYPHLKDKILSAPSANQSEYMRWFRSNTSQDEMNDSLIQWIEFYHKKTEAMPNGRALFCLEDGTACFDGGYPYNDKLPVFRIVPGEIMGSTDGYSDAFDLIGPQEAHTALNSTIFTNQQAFGTQIIWNPTGNNVTSSQIGSGLSFISGPQGQEPKALQLCATPPELFKNLEQIERQMETISGVNSVARGNPESQMGKDASGTALAFMQSMALQYNSGFQQSWAELLEDGGTFIIDVLKKFAKSKRLIAMAGKANRNAMQSFTGDDLAGVDRVVVDPGNPMTKTTAGRVNLADTLLNSGKLNTPQEYMNVLQSGNLEPLLQGKQAQIDRIRSENELLMDGKPVQAMVGDSHLLDMQEHLAVINDPVIRQKAMAGDPFATQVMTITQSHIMNHMQLYQTQTPLWSMVSGEPPAPPPPPMPGMMPTGPGGPPMGPGPGPMPMPPGGPQPHPPMPGAPQNHAPPLPPGAGG